MVERTPTFSVVPTIQPEETIHSWLLRLGRVNGAIDIAKFLKKLLPTNTTLTEVSEINNQSPLELLRKHTLSPLNDLYSTDENNASKTETVIQVASTKLSRGYRTNLKICTACISEDLHTLGYSYLRRGHQIPGVNYCWEHQTRLKDTKTSEYRLLPHEIAEIDAYDECSTPSCMDLEIRYNQLLQHILKEPVRICLSQMLRALRRRTWALGYSSSQFKEGEGKLPVRFYIEKKYGNDVYLLGTPTSGPVRSSKTVVHTLYLTRLPPQRLVLLLAAISDSLDDALSLMAVCTPRLSR